ncbi:hypothetical protein AB2L57_10635 [Microbacterium sp. HA-8]|uniref:hypothetical protein n=1 Tax=Microbacterium sp. HA-8 TaxID=3234200 RepID=UPI0038F77864
MPPLDLPMPHILTTIVLTELPGELITTAGIVTAALLTLIGVVVGHLVAARTARKAQTATRDVTSGELALEIAKEARAEVVTVKAELGAVRSESDARHAQYGLAHRHGSELHHLWPIDALPERPTWPPDLAPPIWPVHTAPPA